MKRAVLKFGGSSVATIPKMKAIADWIIKRKQNGEELVVVVSAIGKTTNELIAMAHSVSLKPSKRELDLLMSTGELITIALFTMLLLDMNCPAISLTGFQAGIKTSGLHTKSRIEDIDTSMIEKYLKNDEVVIVAGFQGFNENMEITTLGRGGSDTTAVSLAAKLGCNCEIYSDVDGIYQVDPKIYPEAKKLETISYQEMKEMAFLGAKIMEPRSIEIGEKYHVPIYVGSSVKYLSGTNIKELVNMEQKKLTGLTYQEKIMMVIIKNITKDVKISDLLNFYATNDVRIDMINYDKEEELTLVASCDDMEAIQDVDEEISRWYQDIKIEENWDLIKLSVVGIGMRTEIKVMAKFLQILTFHEITPHLTMTSENSISFLIDKDKMQLAINEISKAFGL